jgi:alpha/beta superfamily hydrolase
MPARTELLSFAGPAGRIDCAFDWPEGDAAGWALVLHPHSLQGGARDNKIVTTLARAAVQHGLLAVRPDFRGVGQSEGVFDHARGETDDMVALVRAVFERFPELAGKPWVLAGFSFGSAVAARGFSRARTRGADACGHRGGTLCRAPGPGS